MSTSSRVSPVNIPGLCVLALLSTVSLAKVQSQVTKPQATTAQTPAPVPGQPVPPDQVHAITGLPLPPDDPNYVAPPPEPKPLTRAEKLAAARKAATVAANARIAAAKEAAAAKAAERAAAKEAAEKAAAEKAAANKEAADRAAAEKAAAKPAPAAETTAATPVAPAPPKPKRLTKAQRRAAARQAAREAAAERAATAKAAAQQAAADRAAARKAAADKLAADKAAAAEKNEAARVAAAEKAAADKAIAEKAASDKAAADKAAAEERAAAAKNAADKLATEKAAARAAAADRAAAAKAAAEQLAADKAAARAAATEKAVADKAAKDKAVAEKAAADKAAAEERTASAKAAAETAAADKLAASKAAADKLAADKAAAKAVAERAAADKAATDTEKSAAAEKAAAEKKADDAAAAEKAAAAKAATSKLAAEKAVAAKAAADKAANDRIAAEKALSVERAADEKQLAAKSSRIPTPTTITMPSATVADPDANIGKPVPGRPTAVTMPTATVPTDMDAPATKPVTPTRSTVIAPSVVAVRPPPTAKPQPNKPQPAATAPTATAPAAAPTSGVAAIVFLGAEPFTPAELTPLTGLTLGTDPKSDSIQKASQRLIDTGLFSNVAASYDLNGPLGTATFNLKPAAPSDLVRASFANFVWLTPAEIAAALKPVPFYHGFVPINGSLHLATDIEAALAAALKARGINATITHTLVPPSALHPYTALEFRVTDPDTVLETAQVFDVPPTLIAKVLKAQDDAVKIPYNEGIAGTTLTDVLLGPARDAGYLGARLYRIEHKRKSTPSAVYVDYSARMEAGPVYTVRALNWTPSAIYTAADFKRDSALHIGDRPSPEAAAKTEAAILASYRAQGYLEATIASTYNLTPASGAIEYTFTANAGPQYQLHTLTVRGLGPQAKKDFDSSWTIQPGDIYNEDYLLNFLNNHRNIASLSGYTFDYNRTVTPGTHDVDLTLTFKPVK